jgi:triacylglycerol esterase/lipase EstA (alpha/beta hydrolase family)
MKRISLLIALALSGGLVQADDCVVLLHGLMRTSSSMNTMQRELEAAGFLTANIDYPSRDPRPSVFILLHIHWAAFSYGNTWPKTRFPNSAGW